MKSSSEHLSVVCRFVTSLEVMNCNEIHGKLMCQWSDIDGLMQKRRYSIANSLELRLSCTKPSIWSCSDKSVILVMLSSYISDRDINLGQGYFIWQGNLRDFIAVTGLVILLKLDSNRQFFSPCQLEIWWMTLKNNKAPLLCYFKICTSFPTYRWIQTGFTVRKCSNQVKIGNFLSCVTLKFDGWPRKTIGHHSMLLQALCIISKPSVNSN